MTIIYEIWEFPKLQANCLADEFENYLPLSGVMTSYIPRDIMYCESVLRKVYGSNLSLQWRCGLWSSGLQTLVVWELTIILTHQYVCVCGCSSLALCARCDWKDGQFARHQLCWSSLQLLDWIQNLSQVVPDLTGVWEISYPTCNL